MIYLDVTSAVRSVINAGVQRSIRGLYRHFGPRAEVCPVRWDFSARRYTSLSARELGLLTNPFEKRTGPVSIPGFLGDIRDPGAVADRRTRADRALPETFLTAGDVLLIPDLCWDSRIQAWPSLAKMPGHKIAVFHDAMPLRIRGQANSKDELFAEYVRMLAQLELVICVSAEVQEDLTRLWREFGIVPKPTVVLRWPMPFPGNRPENPPNLAARRIIYVARLRLRKNHLVLLDACEQLWSRDVAFSLDLIGMADALVDTSKILWRTARLRARGRPVRWRRHISDEELDRAYRNCSFTVFPSQMEGFGFPVIESLWHRRPVICGGNGAIGEIAREGGCRQVDQNDANELAAAMRELLTVPATYERLCSETDTLAFRTWDDYGRDLHAVLEGAPRAL